MNKLIYVSSVVLAVFAFNASAKYNDTIEKTFELTGKAQLQLENINGDVFIKGWDKEQIQVTANVTAKNQASFDQIKVEMEQSANRIMVETDYEDRDGSWGRNNNGNNGKVEYTIMMPVSTEIRELDVINGSITIDNISGKVDADVVNGSLKATGLASDVKVDSVNGSVKLTFAAQTKNIEVNVETVNGSIKLYLPDDFGAKIEASTGNGSIKTDFGVQGTKGKFYGTDIDTKFGDASSELNLESVNGSIKVMKR